MPPLRTLAFFAVVLAVVAGAHLYVWKRLVRDPGWPRGWRRAWSAAVLVLALAVPASVTLWRQVGAGPATVVTWAGGTWAGAVFLLVVLLACADLARGIGAVVRRARGRRTGVDLGRRRFLARAVAGTAAAGGAALTTGAVVSAARPPEVVTVRLPVRRLAPEFEGFRIVQLSDLHVGPVKRREWVADVVARTNALAPDLVAITGDLADGPADELRDVVAPLADLRARHGVFFSTGNHEYYVGADAWLKHLPSLGVRVLHNERVTIERGAGALDVAGIDDAGASAFGGTHGADLDRALAGRPPSRPVVLLAHQPRQVAEARRLDVDVQLSGHTHGGQIAPFGLLVRLAQPAVAGLHRFGRTWLYVSRGTGTWGPPMRLANPAEIAVVELTRDAVV